MRFLAIFLLLCVSSRALVLPIKIANNEKNSHISTKDLINDLEINTKQQESNDTKQEQNLIPITKNLSIKTDAFAKDGYSEIELESDNTILNEFDSSMSRYGINIGVNLALPIKNTTRINFFISNGIELNTQRRNGKLKPYSTANILEENAYNYGDRVTYSGFNSVVGLAMHIRRNHKLTLILKQTNLSTEANQIARGAPNANAIPIMSVIPTSIKDFTFVGYATTTQIFLTYSYEF